MRQRKKQTPETALKRACAQLLRAFRGFYLPIPGGVMGVAGAPDWIVFYQGLVIPTEFKAPGKYLGPKQKEIKARIEAAGCPYLLVREVKDFSEGLGLPVREIF
jgi:hypothetical protein